MCHTRWPLDHLESRELVSLECKAEFPVVGLADRPFAVGKGAGHVLDLGQHDVRAGDERDRVRRVRITIASEVPRCSRVRL